MKSIADGENKASGYRLSNDLKYLIFRFNVRFFYNRTEIAFEVGFENCFCFMNMAACPIDL